MKQHPFFSGESPSSWNPYLGKLSEVVSLLPEAERASVGNKEFLDTYLEFGIGHHYTLAKILSSKLKESLSDNESISVGLEVAALASASLDNLVTWYVALGHWKPASTNNDLREILTSTKIDNSHRAQSLQHVKDARADEFCSFFGIPWLREELNARGIDVANWRYTVDQARLNIVKAMEDLATPDIASTRDWVAHFVMGLTHDSLVGTGKQVDAPVVRWTVEDEESRRESNTADALRIPTDPESLDRLTHLTGNAAIGLFCIIRLLYVTAFNIEPRSPAFVIIWQDLHPTRGRGA